MVSSNNRKLLIVEKNLVANEGHHHTQVKALTDLLPGLEVHLFTGEGYDGFMGPAAGKLDSASARKARLNSRRRYGSPIKRVKAFILSAVQSEKATLYSSAYGSALIDACRRIGLGPEDFVIVPAADLDDLESSVELSGTLGDTGPQIYHRLLTSEMGESDPRIRSMRLASLKLPAHSGIHVFSETEELAADLANKFSLHATGGFYLPCSMEIQPAPKGRDTSRPFRVGVFGLPKRRKGSHRIGPIVAATAKLAKGQNDTRVDFIVQGTEQDFAKGGVYAALADFPENKGNVSVLLQQDRLSPAEFEHLFESADLILLPYDPTVYGLQGSGIIQDAVAAHKPILHSEGLSMKRFLSHGNAIAANSDDDFAHAILKIVNERDAFREGTARAASFFEAVLRDHPIRRAMGLPKE